MSLPLVSISWNSVINAGHEKTLLLYIQTNYPFLIGSNPPVNTSQPATVHQKNSEDVSDIR